MLQFFFVRITFMDGFPSGQRGQTVNLLQIASVVRIHLHPLTVISVYSVRWCGGIGRRKGLKIPRWQHRAGSSPATSSKFKMWEMHINQAFPPFFYKYTTRFILKRKYIFR